MPQTVEDCRQKLEQTLLAQQETRNLITQTQQRLADCRDDWEQCREALRECRGEL